MQHCHIVFQKLMKAMRIQTLDLKFINIFVSYYLIFSALNICVINSALFVKILFKIVNWKKTLSCAF